MVIVKNGSENLEVGELLSFGYGYIRTNETIYRYLNLTVSGENFDESQLLDASSLKVTINGKTYEFSNVSELKTTRTLQSVHIEIREQI